jgi:hypothetical protein
MILVIQMLLVLTIVVMLLAMIGMCLTVIVEEGKDLLKSWRQR